MKLCKYLDWPQSTKLWCLQGEVGQLKQSNTMLSQQLALHEVEGPRLPHPRSPLKQVPVPSQITAPLSGGCHLGEAKLQQQANQLHLEGNESLKEQLHNTLPKASHCFACINTYNNLLYGSTCRMDSSLLGSTRCPVFA